jgi:hypothetical protein
VLISSFKNLKYLEINLAQAKLFACCKTINIEFTPLYYVHCIIICAAMHIIQKFLINSIGGQGTSGVSKIHNSIKGACEP